MMSSKAIFAALKWVILWSLMAAFVGLLTLIFSFLGAIFCAGLAGMMSRATRHSRWHTLLLASTFPGVLWLVLRLSKAELLPHQVHVLMLVCFATFWFTYVLGWAVVAYERKARSAAAVGDGNGPTAVRANGAEVMPCAAGPAGASITACTVGLGLRQLQGKWRHEVVARPGAEHNGLIEIEDNRLTLSALGPDGRVRCSIQGEFKLERATCKRGLVVSATMAEWPADLSVCI